MNLSPAGDKLIKDFEGFRAKAYKDSKGIWTIGYGTIRVDGKPVVEGMTCTLEQALEWKRQDLARFLPAIERLVKVPLTQNQIDAIVSFVYNVGDGAFASSSLLRAINSKQPVTADLFTRWNKITVIDPHTKQKKLVEVDGLTRRRRAEFALFSKP